MFDNGMMKSDLDQLEFLLDSAHLQRKFRRYFGREMSLREDSTFSEKIQFIKLYFRNDLYAKSADKLAAREFVSKRVGEKYCPKVLGIYDTVEELSSAIVYMPDDFVIKVNHLSQPFGVHIVRGKNPAQLASAYAKLAAELEMNHYYDTRSGQYAYKGIQPKIFVEEFLEDENGELPDYKLYCFEGVVRYIHIDVGRFTEHRRVFYDREWIRQPFALHCPLYEREVHRPPRLTEMIEVAESLSKDYLFCRVDLYSLDTSRIFFGEITHYPGNGFQKFSPHKYDYMLGSLIDYRKILDMKPDIDPRLETYIEPLAHAFVMKDATNLSRAVNRVVNKIDRFYGHSVSYRSLR